MPQLRFDRLQRHVDAVAKEGLAGRSMQDKLASIVAADDLTPEHIKRIAEGANRAVHIGLTKQAYAEGSDPRVLFDLVDPIPLIGQARKAASEEPEVAIAPTGLVHYGDPYRVEVKVASLPLVERPVSIVELEQSDAALRDKISALKRASEQLTAVQLEARQAVIREQLKAASETDKVVENAINLVKAGITLPSLYEAVLAATNGPRASDADRADARAFLRKLVVGLKARGVHNYQLGFARSGIARGEIEKLTVEDLIALCERITLREQYGQALPATAARYLEQHGTKTSSYQQVSDPASLFLPREGKQPWEEAVEWMAKRPTNTGAFSQAYLDCDNLPNGSPRIVDADADFVISIKDLIGAQNRIQKNINSDEYIALKLTEIGEALKALNGAREKVADAVAARKSAFLPAVLPLLGAAARAAGPAIASTIAGAAMSPKSEPAAAPKPTTQAHV